MTHAHAKFVPFMRGLISFLVIVIAWESACRLLHIRSVFVPAPSAVARELASNFAWYMHQAAFTLFTTFAGFLCAVIGGVVLAVAIVSSRSIEEYVYPVIVAMNSVPKVAIAPLLVIWLGTGSQPKIAIAALLGIFPVLVDTVHGLRAVPKDVIDLGRVLKGSGFDFFWKVKFPCALPFIVSGMKVAISLALVGAIVGEFVAAQQGLGYVITSAQGMFDTVRVFAALVVLAVIGVALFAIVSRVEQISAPTRVGR
jgi:NitT/TauT family transport system permease protein